MKYRLRAVALVIGAVVLYGSNYYFSVPKRCTCRILNAQLPQSYLDVIDNSIEDSNSIIFTIGLSYLDDIEQFRICYPHRPKRGRIWTPMGLSEKGCEYQNWYHVTRGSIRKTATEAFIAFELEEQARSIRTLLTGAVQTVPQKRTSRDL